MEPDIGSESRFLLTPTCIRRPIREEVVPVGILNIAMTFGREKLEQCGYPTVNNF